MNFTCRRVILQLLLVVILFSSVTACSGFRHRAYDMAMGMERMGTGLTPASFNVDDFEISVLEGNRRGERPTLVLIHGFGASKEVWLRFARYLKDEFHIIAIDLPGHGESTKNLDKDYHILSQVAYLRAILTEMKVDKPHLAGNSMGATIVAYYAAHYPEEITSITLFNPAGISTHESELMQLLAMDKNPLIIEKKSDYEQLIRFTMKKKPFLIWPITSMLAEKAFLNRSINEKIFNDAQLKESLLHDMHGFNEILCSVRIPTLIIWGKHDRLVNVKNAKIFNERIPDSRLVILDEAGHTPMFETPRASAKIVGDFALEIMGH